MIKWALIYIIMNGHDVNAVNAYGPGKYFDDMYTCFAAREMLASDLGKNGYFPPGMQAICVQVQGERV